MVALYLILQLISMILIIVSKVSFGNILFLNIFKFVPILLNLLFCFSKKVNIKLKLALFFTVIADYCFLFINDCVLGISFFILVQLIYYLYINKTNNRFLILLPCINILFVILFEKKLLYFEVGIYFLLILINVAKTFKLSKNNRIYNLLKISLILLLLCDLCIGAKSIFDLSNIMGIYVDIFEWLFYIFSQIMLVIYTLKLNDAFLYRLLQPIIRFILMVYYNPTIVNNGYISKEGSLVIAGNALDPILVDASTRRVVHTLAKKDLHDGKFGWFFRAIGTIPVDLHAEHNKEALNSAIEYLNNGCLINLSPEAKRNYTEEILLPFKYGAVVMAKRTNSKIVPYSITGDYKFRSKNLKIVFGEPLDISELSIEEANELLYKKVKKLILDNRE